MKCKQSASPVTLFEYLTLHVWSHRRVTKSLENTAQVEGMHALLARPKNGT